MNSFNDEIGYFKAVFYVILKIDCFLQTIVDHNCGYGNSCVFNIIRQTLDRNISQSDLSILKKALFETQPEVEFFSLADLLSIILNKINLQEVLEKLPPLSHTCKLNVEELIECCCNFKANIKWNDTAYVFPVMISNEKKSLTGHIQAQYFTDLNFCASSKCYINKSKRRLNFINYPDLIFFDLIWTDTDLHVLKKVLSGLETEFKDPFRVQAVSYKLKALVITKYSDFVYLSNQGGTWISNGNARLNNLEEISQAINEKEIPRLLIYELIPF